MPILARGLPKIVGRLGDERGAIGVAKLRRLHNDQVINSSNLVNYQNLSKESTDTIIASLKPGSKEALIVKPNGLIMNGNTRIRILQERGVEVDSLPREFYK